MEHMYILSVPLLERFKSSPSHLVLPHLYDDPLYLDTYRRFSKQGDWLMQDNSIFELRKIVPGDLINFARRINANEVVVPEVLRDSGGCIEKTAEFFDKIGTEDRERFQFAAAIQGRSFSELAYHYKIINEEFPEIKTFCIVFDYEFDAFGDVDETKRQSGWNRFSIIWRLVEEKVWNPRKNHHLLGLFNPAELAMYRKHFSPVVWSSIRSNDSSSCFWHSVYGVRFSSDIGLLYKKIETHVDFSVKFDHAEQKAFFWLNRDLMEQFRSGVGGTRLWERYVEYGEAAEIQL